jgi:hypothetical protein
MGNRQISRIIHTNNALKLRQFNRFIRLILLLLLDSFRLLLRLEIRILLLVLDTDQIYHIGLFDLLLARGCAS